MKKHILIVDDEQDVREVLSQALALSGYRVTAAETGHEANRLAKSDPPQLMISDLQMEDADGLELIEQIKAIYPDLPVILLTGMIFDPETIRDNINKKVSVYLDKTCSLQRVTQEIQRLLGDENPAASAPVGK
jgi:DNA-binding NtrC family response regulator